MNLHEQSPPSRVVERILGSRSMRQQGDYGQLTDSNNTATYEAYTLTPGFPRMGFTLGVYIRGANGLEVESHGILFHDVKKPKWKSYKEEEFVSFSHSGEAYTLRGRGLYEFYLGLMENTVQSVLEYEPSVFGDPVHGAPIIDRVTITDVAEMARRSRDDRNLKG